MSSLQAEKSWFVVGWQDITAIAIGVLRQTPDTVVVVVALPSPYIMLCTRLSRNSQPSQGAQVEGNFTPQFTASPQVAQTRPERRLWPCRFTRLTMPGAKWGNEGEMKECGALDWIRCVVGEGNLACTRHRPNPRGQWMAGCPSQRWQNVAGLAGRGRTYIIRIKTPSDNWVDVRCEARMSSAARGETTQRPKLKPTTEQSRSRARGCQESYHNREVDVTFWFPYIPIPPPPFRIEAASKRNWRPLTAGWQSQANILSILALSTRLITRPSDPDTLPVVEFREFWLYSCTWIIECFRKLPQFPTSIASL